MDSEVLEWFETGSSGQKGKMQVLLVDEAPDDLNYTKMLLQALGCEVFACRSYAEGARKVEGKSWDFAVVSQGSPAFEGRCVLERVLTMGRKLPILVLARFHDMHCYLQAMQLGAVDYLEEPVSWWEMHRVLGPYASSVVPPRFARVEMKR